MFTSSKEIEDSVIGENTGASVVCIGAYPNTVVPLKNTDANIAAAVPILLAFLFFIIINSTLLFIVCLAPNKLFFQTTGTCLFLAERFTRVAA